MPAFVVEKLSDHFGQYMLLIRCECGYTRNCDPITFAKVVGWDATLKDVVRRLRCSRCDKKACVAQALAVHKPRGYKDPR